MNRESTIPELIRDVRARDAAATPEPWEQHRYAAEVVDEDGEAVAVCNISGDRLTGGTPTQHNNAALIALYRTAAPRLARECERLLDEQAAEKDRDTARAEVERLRALLDAYEPDSITAARELERLRAERADLQSRLTRSQQKFFAVTNGTMLDEVNRLRREAEADRGTARAVLARIAANLSCEPADDADLIEAVRLLVVERDKGKAARAEVERLRHALKLVGGCDTNHAQGACPAPPCRRRDTSVPKETP